MQEHELLWESQWNELIEKWALTDPSMELAKKYWSYNWRDSKLHFQYQGKRN